MLGTARGRIEDWIRRANFELLVDGEQAMHAHWRRCGGRPHSQGSRQKTRNRELRGWVHRAKTNVGEIAVEHKCTKDRETNGEDAVFPGPRLSQAARPENDKVGGQTANDGEHKIAI